MQNRIDELRSVLRADPGSRRFFQLGDLLRKIGRLAEAEQILRKGLEQHPKYTAAWISLGRVQLDEGQYPEAERSFARSLELAPENSVAARLLGDTASAGGEHVRAIKAYKLARALGDPELDEKIDEVQALIDGGEVTAIIDVPPPLQWKSEVDLRADADSAVESPEQDVVTIARPPQEAVFLSEEDPFGVSGDAPFDLSGDDVFSALQGDEADLAGGGEGADVFGSQTEVAGGQLIFAEDEKAFEEPAPGVPLDEAPEPDRAITDLPPVEIPAFNAEEVPSSGGLPSEALEAEALEPGGQGATDQGLGDSAAPEPDLPLPTLTLARLAYQQGDVAMAESTLRLLILKEPDNPEALALLEEIGLDVAPAQASDGGFEDSAAPPAGLDVVPPRDLEREVEDGLTSEKIRVLETWRVGIRRASQGARR